MTAEQAPAPAPPLPPQLAGSVKLRLFLALRRVISAEAMAPVRGDHLNWVIEQERTGRLFLAGPVKPCGGATALDGLMVFRAAAAEEAAAIAGQDPFVVAGGMAVEICQWTVLERSLPLTLSLSDSSLELR